MRQFGIRAAQIEVDMVWSKGGPRQLAPVRTVYYATYDGREQITDVAKLARIQASGLEEKLKAEAVRIAPDGHWIDLPAYPPFRASTAVIIWDDPWLPTPPRWFTTFGPGQPPLIAAVGFEDLADIDRLLASGKIGRKDINDALWYACGQRNTLVLQRLLKAGADVNQTRHREEFGTCLMIAIWSHAPETVKILVASGAKVNGPQGIYDETPLTLAANRGCQSTGIVKMLLDAGADANAANSYGFTALIKAANSKAEVSPLLELLISHGADVNAKARKGGTALCFAVRQGNLNAVKVLLAARADVNVRDEYGISVSQMAPNKEIADLLSAAGASK